MPTVRHNGVHRTNPALIQAVMEVLSEHSGERRVDSLDLGLVASMIEAKLHLLGHQVAETTPGQTELQMLVVEEGLRDKILQLLAWEAETVDSVIITKSDVDGGEVERRHGRVRVIKVEQLLEVLG